MTVFHSTSPDEAPQILHVAFSDPAASLGCQLVHLDKKADHEMFFSGYAMVGKFVGDANSAAVHAGVQIGDVIVAVNGQGFRRFGVEYDDETVTCLSHGSNDVTVTLDHAVVPAGSAYDELLACIKMAKSDATATTPMILTLERYGWDARAHAWPRFLAARQGAVPAAMVLLQQHESWKTNTFPMPLASSGLQAILSCQAVSEIDLGPNNALPPTVYVNYGALMKLQAAGTITADDIVQAFVIFTERMLGQTTDASHPQLCQFVDLTEVSYMSMTSMRVEALKKIYAVFEPNYPETLHRMIMYPVSTMFSTTCRTMLSFVNERTQAKFVLTNDLAKVCESLGWQQADVEAAGGVVQFVHAHEKAGDLLLSTSLSDDMSRPPESAPAAAASD